MAHIEPRAELGARGRLGWRGLFSAGVISSFGDEFTRVALPAQLYALGGGLTQVAWLGIVQILPLAGAAWSGSLADRGRERPLLIGGDLLRAACLILLIAAPNWQTLLFLALCIQIGSVLFTPAETALESRLLQQESIVDANALRVMARSITRIVGPLAAAALLSTGSLSTAFVIDAVTFLLSATLIATLITRPPSVAAPPEDSGPTTEPRSMSLLTSAGLRPLFAAQILMYAVFGLQGPLIFDFAARQLAPEKAAYGILMAALSIGTVGGALLFPALLSRAGAGRRQQWLGAVVVIDAAALVMFALSTNLVAAASWMTAMGIVSAAFQIMMRSAIQQSPAESARGRIAGLFTASATPVMIASLLLAAPLRNWSGSTPRALLYAAALEIGAALALLAGGRQRTAPH